MKVRFLAFLLLCSVSHAQQQPAAGPLPRAQAPAAVPSESLPENFVLTLTVGEKTQITTRVSLVTATGNFKTIFSDVPAQTFGFFAGTVTPKENGLILVQYQGNEVQASVLLRPGVPVEILKYDDRVYKLTVSRLSDQPVQDK